MPPREVSFRSSSELLCQPFVQVAITTVLVLLALRKKNRPDAVVYALVSGFTLAVFVVRLIF